MVRTFKKNKLLICPSLNSLRNKVTSSVPDPEGFGTDPESILEFIDPALEPQRRRNFLKSEIK
jgi:hypothetical protein